MSSFERTGWRDEALSARHRGYGFDCPMTDIDGLLTCEYDRAEPVCLLEYKCKPPMPPNMEDPQFRVLRRLGDRAGLPVVLAYYEPESWSYTLYPLNGLAEEWVLSGEQLSEVSFVNRLHLIRGRTLPQEVGEKLESESHDR